MNLASVRPGDIVRVEKKGRVFLAYAGGREDGLLRIDPVQRGITYLSAQPREVTAHWRKSKASRT